MATYVTVKMDTVAPTVTVVSVQFILGNEWLTFIKKSEYKCTFGMNSSQGISYRYVFDKLYDKLTNFHNKSEYTCKCAFGMNILQGIYEKLIVLVNH